ncbi:MAG: transposase [Roseovarius sp.]|nr:transposase [Roseovarius sp.]
MPATNGPLAVASGLEPVAPSLATPRTNGGQCLAFGAVCPERGTTAALVMPHADAQAMNAHLVEISKTVAEGAHAILVLDGAGWHGSKALCIPENITLLLLPPYAPELTPIENVWACLRANRLAISVFEADAEIVARCCDAWNFFAGDIEAVRSITTRDYAKAVK